MDKQQRIEQISNIISNSCCNIEPIHNCTSSCNKCIAESIYDKIFSENAVVLTEKEYGELYQRMFDEVRQANDLKVEQARREMAEKIYNMAEEVVEKTKYIVDDKLYLHIDVLKLIIEQLGVDLGEEK